MKRTRVQEGSVRIVVQREGDSLGVPSGRLEEGVGNPEQFADFPELGVSRIMELRKRVPCREDDPVVNAQGVVANVVLLQKSRVFERIG